MAKASTLGFSLVAFALLFVGAGCSSAPAPVAEVQQQAAVSGNVPAGSGLPFAGAGVGATGSAQVQVVNPAPVVVPVPAPTTTTPTCTADVWTCGSYGVCSSKGLQTRVCTMTTDCPTATTPKPSETRSCTPPANNAPAPKPTPAPTPAPTPIAVPAPSVKSFSITARQWSFTPSEIRVKKGDTVKITITSADVSHGFMLPEFGVSETLEPGKTTNVQFVASKQGTFSFFCTVFCGAGHSGMNGRLVVE